ncbi:MAG: type IV pilus assembly protein PilM [Planctomycetes bacterium]|nr:type IV pilus assembly protein PilM [Planctomycetota bacterium]
MASSVHGVWAIDIGTCSLKALRLRPTDEGIEVVGFDYLEHGKILSAAGVSAQEKHNAIAQTLRQFLSRNDIGKDPVAISIAGQNSFARFVKLPPVEPKKVPEIIQFEAVQQIPFDINEVEWDWQKMEAPDGGTDAEVGIFAIKNELIAEIMDHFTRENLHVTCVQISPMAMYNYILYDRKDIAAAGRKGTIILDIGAENSTLVICTRDSVWQRSIRIGGNSFTQAIAEAFKLNFEKAEKLKRSAPMSKYMRQIYTAMKPVYTELSGELQRSLGFYGSSGPGRDQGFTGIIAMGGGMKLQGLPKYLQQSLGIAVVKPDSFEKLKSAPDISAAGFHENICDFGIVYGLGVQLLDQAKITVNLLPSKIARAMAWNRKAKLLMAAAAVLVLVSLLSLGWAFRELTQYNANESIRGDVTKAVAQADAAIRKMEDIKSKSQPLAGRIQKQFDLFKYREMIPLLNEQMIACLPDAQNTPDQADLFEAFEKGTVQEIKAIPRGQRKQVFITRVMIEYAADLPAAQFPDPTKVITPSMEMQGGLGNMTPSMMMEGEMMMQEGFGGTQAAAPVEAPPSGFVVLIEGYTPYRKVNELLDPTGVANDPSKWGIVTRFENLGKIIKGTPFELFRKNDTSHFKEEFESVIASSAQSLSSAGGAKQPVGIGILREVRRVPEASEPSNAPVMERMMPEMMGGGARGGIGVQDRITAEMVLVDPMTDEEMSKTYDFITPQDVAGNSEWSEKDIGRKKYDFGKEKFIERDSWFRIQAKFIWKGAPQIQLPAGSMMNTQPMPSAPAAGQFQ